MKTLNDLKEEVARDRFASSFLQACTFIQKWAMEVLMDEVAKRYATEAIKADREKIKEHFDDCEYADHVIDGIDNTPIELK